MLGGLLLISALYPLVIAWRANRRTSLKHAIGWSFAAWLAWGIALILLDWRPGSWAQFSVYLALCLTGCTSVAVLGARRPGAMGWNFVVLALLAVMMLPLAEGLGELRLDPLRLIFLCGTVGVGLLNYLPTQLAATATCIAIGCGLEIALLHQNPDRSSALEKAAVFSRILLAMSPWFAWFAFRGLSRFGTEYDRTWFHFRDRFGVVWGQRVREQFNRAAVHADLPVILRWRGMRLLPGNPPPNERQRAEIAATLHALLKRFEE